VWTRHLVVEVDTERSRSMAFVVSAVVALLRCRTDGLDRSSPMRRDFVGSDHSRLALGGVWLFLWLGVVFCA
jgi:hypothetical protein